MAAHYLTRVELEFCFLLWERQIIRCNADALCCKQSYGEFKIQNSRFQRLIPAVWIPESGIWTLGLWNLESPLSLESGTWRLESFQSGILNLESAVSPLPNIVGQQILISISLSNQIRFSAVANHHRGRQRPPVVMKHLRQRISS